LDFVKGVTVQELTPAGLLALGPTAVTLAEMEGLDAHANAVTRRLAVLNQTASADGGSKVGSPEAEQNVSRVDSTASAQKIGRGDGATSRANIGARE
jgi:hypothetical protein